MGGSKKRDDTGADLDRLMEAWRQYGRDYNIFDPEEQPAPKGGAWQKPFPESSEQGTFDPQTLKHWKLVNHTKAFLRKRYEEHGILRGPALTFDCLVPKYQKPLQIPEDKRKKYRLPKHADPASWYAAALKLIISPDGEVGIVCNSVECLRNKCKLNRNNPNRMSPVDLYSIVQIFHGFRSVARAKAIVAESFQLKLGHFESRGVEQKPKIKRYAVPKHMIMDLIGRYANMRRQQVPRLVQESVDLVKSCDLVELDHVRVFSSYFAFFWPQIIDNAVLTRISSPAIKLYLWLLMEQEERARRNEFAMKLTDSDVSRAVGIDPKTAGRYRKQLEKIGLLRVKSGAWTVGYTVKSQCQSK